MRPSALDGRRLATAVAGLRRRASFLNIHDQMTHETSLSCDAWSVDRGTGLHSRTGAL